MFNFARIWGLHPKRIGFSNRCNRVQASCTAPATGWLHRVGDSVELHEQEKARKVRTRWIVGHRAARVRLKPCKHILSLGHVLYFAAAGASPCSCGGSARAA